MQILSDELEKDVLNIIGIDRLGVFKMYRDYKICRSHFERNFVMDEGLEANLAERVYRGFLCFDMSQDFMFMRGGK